MFRASAMSWSFADRTCMGMAGMLFRMDGAERSRGTGKTAL